MVGNEAAARHPASILPPVLRVNAEGRSPFVLVCDHASNRIPEEYGDLGLTHTQRLMHIAWDPGALAVALELSDRLDAPLIHSTISRLIVDCNRDEDAVDLSPTISERTEIPGNASLSEAERRRRVEAYHRPFHETIDALLTERAAQGRVTFLVTIHSFTPVYKEVKRPWPIGLIHGADERFTRSVRDALDAEDANLDIGWNQPYAAGKGVTYTIEHHGDGRQLPTSMIEIRHDEILEPSGVALWASRLARCLHAAHQAFGTREKTAMIGANSGGING